MSIHSIEKVDLVERVFEQMKDNIISGEWNPGEKIPSENDLCKMFNVSRNTVRSAIQKLKAIGAVTSEQGKGTFVYKSIADSLIDSFIPLVSLDEEEMMDIVDFRDIIENESARLAAKRATEEDLEHIRRSLDNMIANTHDYKKFSIADYQFHLSIVKASKNRIFYKAMLRLKDVIYNHLEEMNRNGDLVFSINGHVRLFDAIKSRDYELAGMLSKSDKEIVKQQVHYNYTNK
ncbi:DNA-binding FadR family transcriptional regulator [Hydrogenispora ethanolica]|jgi:DNA-binding FadR family transcriptional regulator|uniref:DNA-binding FadR family transcriptional regulator n=1 Tax=Hydrogenispora ethanolica TaxID=1082276 RepID=A0A4R1S2S9_HYDET|nr:FadR/GntR family transcriptional regulator [Hydrogenispora ethanolica]TCL73349.1 DNA-binding FadR family transcriptional regulator [Hydrogenispora ethanolica]